MQGVEPDTSGRGRRHGNRYRSLHRTQGPCSGDRVPHPAPAARAARLNTAPRDKRRLELAWSGRGSRLAHRRVRVSSPALYGISLTFTRYLAGIHMTSCRHSYGISPAFARHLARIHTTSRRHSHGISPVFTPASRRHSHGISPAFTRYLAGIHTASVKTRGSRGRRGGRSRWLGRCRVVSRGRVSGGLGCHTCL